MAVHTSGLGLDCHSCTTGLKRWRGCEEPVEATEFEFEGVVLTRCPLKLITPISIAFMRFYGFTEKGFLPNAGGILDQPNRFVEAMTIITATINREREEEEKSRKDRDRSAQLARQWKGGGRGPIKVARR